jgi:uncharacterized protein (UPF0276 family)
MTPSSLSIKPLGCGVSYRSEFRSELLRNSHEFEVLEIITEQFMRPAALRELDLLRERFSIVPHGLGLSVGSIGQVDSEYLKAVKRISDRTRSPYYSDHLAITRVPGIELGQLAPIVMTEDVLRNVIGRVNTVQDALGKTLVLEIITEVVRFSRAEMNDGEFLTRLVNETGCGLLLDVTNVAINAANHHLDAVEFLAMLPSESVVQVHLAGGIRIDGFEIDSHSEPIAGETWRLFENALDHFQVRCTIVERDENSDDFDQIVGEVRQARDLVQSRLSRNV